MRIKIEAKGINDEATKVLVEAIKKLYKPYSEHYMGFDNFTIEIGGEE